MTAPRHWKREDILPLLGPVKRQGEGVMAFCPAHADGTKHGGKAGHSLIVHQDGTTKCFAGCTWPQIEAALIARSKSGPPREQAAPKANAQQWPREPVVAYEYRDPMTGDLLAVKGRFERPDPDGGKSEKTFRWRLPEGSYAEGFRDKYTIRDLPLWKAECVAKAPRDQRVWFTEGEKAASTLHARNEIAVCGAWGASQRDYGDALAILAGRTVYLWPDNDQPGREYMAEIRKALRGIARQVFVINAPVPPKGDAFEYFQAGGTVEDLLANVLDRPTVDVLSATHFAVRIPTDQGPIKFDFGRITRAAGAMDCELVVSHLNPAYEGEPYAIRINLMSASARSQLETSLGKQFGKDITPNWTILVSIACSRLREAYSQLDRATHISALPDMEEPAFLVDTLLPENADTIIFGDGSSGKTYMAYGMALEVAMGGVFCGHRAQQGGVVILDYETGERMAKFRMRRLLLGAGLDPALLSELPIHYIDSEGVPLPELRDTLRRTIERHDVKLLIIDAAGDACGGEPEKAGTVLAYFNACAELKATRLHIAHVTNTELDASARRPFGSRYWHNRARRTWFVKRDQEEDSDDIDVGFICRKVNDGRLPKPEGFHITFDGTSGPVRIVHQDFREVAAFEADQTIADRVERFLAARGTPATIREIADEEGIDANKVKTTLNRNKGKRFVLISGAGKQNHWGAMAQ